MLAFHLSPDSTAACLTNSPDKLFSFMCRLRHVEESLLRLLGEGKLSGTTHTCIGQEAIAAAMWATLTPDDSVFSSHRCHAHFLASGNLVKAGAVLDTGVRLGGCCIVDCGVIVPHDCVIYSGAHLAPDVSMGGICPIGRDL